jgi:Holliday junction resolvasome RuvABC ATP-dependent DNA helicase subunit
VLDAYTVAESTMIATALSGRVGFGDDVPALDPVTATLVAEASNGNPRDMRALLIALRDSYFAASRFDVELALEWAGVTADGLPRVAQDYLLTLLVSDKDSLGEKVIASAMGEPGPLRHTEQLLIQKGLVTITTSGRSLTPAGVERASQLVIDRGLVDADDAAPVRRLRSA